MCPHTTCSIYVSSYYYFYICVLILLLLYVSSYCYFYVFSYYYICICVLILLLLYMYVSPYYYFYICVLILLLLHTSPDTTIQQVRRRRSLRLSLQEGTSTCSMPQIAGIYLAVESTVAAHMAPAFQWGAALQAKWVWALVWVWASGVGLAQELAQERVRGRAHAKRLILDRIVKGSFLC
jgi:hypothetical protein